MALSTSSIGKKNITDILGSIERGGVLVAEKAESEEMRALYYEYWAYQYAMLLGLTRKIHTDSEYPSILKRLKKLKWLLHYDHVKKVKAVHLLVNCLGVSNAVRVLSVYYSTR